MKIGILVTIISGFGKKGFYHSQEIGLGEYLSGQGHTVEIYKCVDKKNNSKHEEKISDSVKIIYIPVKHVGVHGYIPGNYIGTDLDVLLSFADTQLFLKHVYDICVKNNIVFIPYIGIAHSGQRNLKSKFFDAFFKMSTLKIYQNIPVLAKTPQAEEELKALGINDVTVVPVGIDRSKLKEDFESYDRNEIREKFGFNKEDTIISFVGRMKSEKNPIKAVRIFASILRNDDSRSYKMIMVGEGYQYHDVLNEIKDWDLSDRVRVIERVRYEDMWQVHYMSDYYITLCDREIFGMALMEAIYYRTSVAAIHAAGPDAIIVGLEGHTLCDNYKEVEKWIIESRPKPEDLKKSAEILLERYSWKRCADAIEKIAGREEGSDA